MSVHKPNKTQYAYWQVEGTTDPVGYWALFNTLEDAVFDAPEGTTFYRFDAISVGKYKREVSLVRVKRKYTMRKRKKRTETLETAATPA